MTSFPICILIYRRRDQILRQRLPDRPSEDISSIYYTSGRKEIIGSGDTMSSSRPTTVSTLDQYPSQENDYYRTWQMQRHALSGPGGVIMPGSHGFHPPYPGHAQTLPHDTSGPGTKYTFQPVEHIYESPKFERRDIKYYELDPTASSHNCDVPTANRYST